MKTKTVKKLLSKNLNPKVPTTIFFILACACVLSCKPKNNFVGVGPQDNLRPAATAEPRSEIFQNRFNAKVDVVFIVDNSPSMADEIVQVRNNMRGFVGELKLKTDVRVGVISRSTAPAVRSMLGDTTLSLASDVTKQIDVEVGSKNPLAILAASLCPTEQTQAIATSANNTVCTLPTGALEDPENVLKARASLMSMMRSDARTVFIVITDDDPVNLSDAVFMRFVNARFSQFRPVIYAFTGLPDSSTQAAKSSAELMGSLTQSTCTIANPGVSYARLANQTGGQLFDLCKADWQSSFVTLRQGILAHLQATFLLKSNPSQIVSIEVDGIKKSVTDAVIQGQQVYISGLNPDYKTLSIRYK